MNTPPRIKAYILAADPAWIEESIRSYYDIVEEIIVSYDQNRRGFTGVPIPVDECLAKLRSVDPEGKMRFLPGDYYGKGERSPMDVEVYQRRVAIEAIGTDVDWILQMDTDEVLRNPARLFDMLDYAGREGIDIVEWPMRVIFQSLRDGRFLEVCGEDGTDRFEYPGPIAIRPHVVPQHGRRGNVPFLRAAVHGDNKSLQVSRDLEPNERRLAFCQSEDAILHFSWARSPQQMRRKVASWGHYSLKAWVFYALHWRSAPYIWRWLRDFHPFARGLWPALRAQDYSSILRQPATSTQSYATL